MSKSAFAAPTFGSPEATAPPLPAPDTLPGPLATRYRAAAPTEGASPRGRRGTGPGDGERETWRGVPRFTNRNLEGGGEIQ